MTSRIKNITQVTLILVVIISYNLFFSTVVSFSQVESTEKRYVRIGSLQSHFSAYGSERAWNNSYYEGLIWPADYPYQDNAVIKRSWMAVDDFTDAKGAHWEKYGIYFAADYTGESIFPVELKQTAKFKHPIVYVDGIDVTSRFATDIDDIDPDQVCDRIVTNVVNTSMGLTMTRKIYAFSQQYHDNYFIKEFIFTNTGNVDYDDEIELNAPLKGVRISWGTRYSVCREGSFATDNQQSWGKHTWVTRRGEDYPSHANETITETNPIVDWLRCGWCWTGQAAKNVFDNIGGPDIGGNGRLTAPQHAGTIVLHVDQSVTDKTDNPNQPTVLGWHAGDTYPSLGDMSSVTPMIQLYDMLSGNPYKGLGGSDRFFEENTKSILDRVDPWTIHNDGGGTNLWIAYGPFDLQPGESVSIYEAEGINGLNRQQCEEIGKRWKKAYDDPTDTGPFILPNGTTTNDKDLYKNTWFYTGQDSILLTFGRALRNLRLNFKIPEPPQPPASFEVKSGGDRIRLSWEPSPSENDAGFAGYKIFRAIGKADTVYEEIYSGGAEQKNFDDITAARGFSYYYYIVAFNDGSNNTTGAANPTGPLFSNRFYTRTTEPAYLRRQAGNSLESIRVVPNPYNVSSYDLQFIGEPDKIMFLNIPGQCTIRIYTERGDLIYTIEHTDGSGDETWNSITLARQVVVSGIYIAHFTVNEDYNHPETGELLYKKGETAIRKFVIIR